MRYMGWDYGQLAHCKMRHYRAIVALISGEARR